MYKMHKHSFNVHKRFGNLQKEENGMSLEPLRKSPLTLKTATVTNFISQKP